MIIKCNHDCFPVTLQETSPRRAGSGGSQCPRGPPCQASPPRGPQKLPVAGSRGPTHGHQGGRSPSASPSAARASVLSLPGATELPPHGPAPSPQPGRGVQSTQTQPLGWMLDRLASGLEGGSPSRCALAEGLPCPQGGAPRALPREIGVAPQDARRPRAAGKWEQVVAGAHFYSH